MFGGKRLMGYVPFDRRFRVVVVEGPALRRRGQLHGAHEGVERVAALRLDEIGEARRFEREPAFAVALQGPPFVPAVHLVHEGQVVEHHALADRPVAALEVLAKRVDVVDATELVGVLFEERVVLPVVAADLEPAVLLAFLDEPAAFVPADAVLLKHVVKFMPFHSGSPRIRAGRLLLPALKRRPSAACMAFSYESVSYVPRRDSGRRAPRPSKAP